MQVHNRKATKEPLPRPDHAPPHFHALYAEYEVLIGCLRELEKDESLNVTDLARELAKEPKINWDKLKAYEKQQPTWQLYHANPYYYIMRQFVSKERVVNGRNQHWDPRQMPRGQVQKKIVDDVASKTSEAPPDATEEMVVRENMQHVLSKWDIRDVGALRITQQVVVTITRTVLHKRQANNAAPEDGLPRDEEIKALMRDFDATTGLRQGLVTISPCPGLVPRNEDQPEQQQQQPLFYDPSQRPTREQIDWINTLTAYNREYKEIYVARCQRDIVRIQGEFQLAVEKERTQQVQMQLDMKATPRGPSCRDHGGVIHHNTVPSNEPCPPRRGRTSR